MTSAERWEAQCRSFCGACAGDDSRNGLNEGRDPGGEERGTGGEEEEGEVEEQDPDITKEKVQTAVNKIKSRKAAGDTCFKVELLRPGIIDMLLAPTARCSKSFSREWGLLVFWVIICVKLMKDSVDMMEPKLQHIFFYEAFLYYNPLFMVALMVWLWGFNIWGLSHSRISYPRVFDLDHNHLTHWDIWKIAMWLSVVVLTSMAAYLYLFSHGAKHLAASQPVLLYCTLPLIMALPFDILYASSRYYFLNTLFRLTFPLQPISFADFFVADILTSLAKVLSDLERSICRMANNQVATIAWMDKDDLCGSHSLMIPCVLAFPYLCRFFQCLRQYSDTKERPCLFNALKYATAFPVIFLSATKYHVTIEAWHFFYKHLWIGSAIINSCYSFFWDITRDWDFGCFSGNCKTRNPLLRNNLYFPNKGVYYYVIVSNLILRGTWTYKLSSHLRNNYVLVWIFCFLEMVRRFQWVFFRVENEWNKMTMRGLTGSSQNLKEVELRAEESSPLLPPSVSRTPSMHRDG